MFAELEIEKIEPNPFQPRTVWDPEKLEEMAVSIMQVGIVQPLLVRRYNGGYQLIAGERRFRGAQKAGLTTVPVIIREASDEEMLKLALIENLHRDDMSPIDRASGFRDLMDKFNMTQKVLAEVFNLSRPAIANTVRLLDLDEEIKAALHNKQLTEGHARALLSLRNPADRISFFKRIVSSNLSVRESEELSKKIRSHYRKRIADSKNQRRTIHEDRLIDELRMKFGTKINILNDGGMGKIEIEFYSDEDFDRIIDTLLSSESTTIEDI